MIIPWTKRDFLLWRTINNGLTLLNNKWIVVIATMIWFDSMRNMHKITKNLKKKNDFELWLYMKSWTTYLVLPNVSLKTLPQLNYYILCDKCEYKPLTALLWLIFSLPCVRISLHCRPNSGLSQSLNSFIICFLDHFCATDGHVFNKLGFAGLILQVPFFRTGWTTLFLLLS